MSLIKSKLIQNITEANPHLFVRDVERIVNTIFNEITQSLADGKRVELRGWCIFSSTPKTTNWKKPKNR